MPCNIYLATDIVALDALAKKSLAVMKDIKLRQAYKAVDRLYTHLYIDSVDEEKTYVHMSRFLFMLDYIYNLEHDTKYLHLKYDHQKSQVAKEQQVLRDNLIKRYADLNKQRVIIEEEEEEENAPVEVDENLFDSGRIDCFVTCHQLYEGCRLNQNILIMDMRSKQDFNNSHLKINTVINIDESVVITGLSANKLGEKLEKPIKDVYDKRNTFEYIILMDFDTTPDLFDTSKVKNLFTILTEWDYNTIYKHPPYILNGGYINFVDRYPTYSTNPNVLLQLKYSDLDELLDLDTVYYPEEFSPVKEDVSHINIEIDNTYQEVVELTIQLFDIEKKLLHNQYKIYDPNNASIKNELEKEIELLTTTKSDLVTKNKIINAKLKALLEKRPRESFKYKAEIGRIESEIVVLSRKRRKLVDAHKVEVPIIPTTPTPLPPIPPKVTHAVGDRPFSQILPDAPQIPTIDRKTKPKIHPNSLKENSGLVGLNNIRNSCYINSIIQCLRYLPSMKKYFMSNRYEHDISRKPPLLICQMGDLIKKLWTTPNKSISPTDFYKRIAELNPSFKHGRHEDASEFFMFMYEQIFEDTAAPIDRDRYAEVKYKTFYDRIEFRTSFFVNEFFHQIRTHCVCSGCSKNCIKYDIENVLMFGVPKDGTGSVEDMYYKFIHTCDIISDYYCSKCERQSDFIRDFTHQPKVIAILLKRYSFTKGYAERVNTPCDFPLDNFRIGKAVYKLWSVSLHQGVMEAGHYTAVCLNHGDGMWYEFNDETVRPIDITSRAVKEKAYMLFYESHPGSPVGFSEQLGKK